MNPTEEHIHAVSTGLGVHGSRRHWVRRVPGEPTGSQSTSDSETERDHDETLDATGRVRRRRRCSAMLRSHRRARRNRPTWAAACRRRAASTRTTCARRSRRKNNREVRMGSGRDQKQIQRHRGTATWKRLKGQGFVQEPRRPRANSRVRKRSGTSAWRSLAANRWVSNARPPTSAPGEIVTNPLAGQLVWEKWLNEESRSIWSRRRRQLLVEFPCGLASAKVEGSVMTNIPAGSGDDF